MKGAVRNENIVQNFYLAIPGPIAFPVDYSIKWQSTCSLNNCMSLSWYEFILNNREKVGSKMNYKNSNYSWSDDDYIYVKWYIHWRTGKKMIAKDYGYEAWRFKKAKKKRK